MQDIAQVLTFVLAGMGIGWVSLFSFVVSPVSYTTFDGGRAERIVKAVMNRGHGLLGLLAFFAAIAALVSGAIAGASVAAIAGVFAFLCKFALAPREDKPIQGRRVIKTARIVASGLTAFLMPILIAAIVLTAMGI
jgi:hypothetical protein